MKSKKLSLAIMGFFAGLLISAAAHADLDLSGAHRGIIQGNKKKVDLVLRSLREDGRDGSYLALMVQHDPDAVCAFLIDKDQGNKYAMVPQNVTGDGQVVGTNNPDPSLGLLVDGTQDGRVSFTITNAKSSNHDCFQGSIDFTGDKTTDTMWNDLVPGLYKLKHGDGYVRIPSALEDGQAGIDMALAPPLSGGFMIRNKRPGLYTLANVEMKSTGDETAKYPSYIGLFVSKGVLGGGDYFVLVDPNNYTSVILMERK